MLRRRENIDVDLAEILGDERGGPESLVGAMGMVQREKGLRPKGRYHGNQFLD